MKIVLNAIEIAELDRQAPGTASDGGFQGLIVSLQKRVNRATGELTLNADDLRRIPACAFDYGNGGWQTRLLAIFGRCLGAKLDR